MAPNRTPAQYTDAVYNAMLSNRQNLLSPGAMYHGREGALRLAREYGYGLADWPEAEHKDEIQSSYGRLLVRLSNLNPPIDAKPWAAEIRKSIARRLG